MEDFRNQTQRLIKDIEATAKLELENLQAFSSNEEKIHRQVRVCIEEAFILQTAQQDLRRHVMCPQYGPAAFLCTVCRVRCALCHRWFSDFNFQHHTCDCALRHKKTPSRN